MSTQDIENSHLVPLYGKRDISLVSGNGSTVVDEDGNEYLDCVNGVGAVILGYNHPVYVEGMTEQVSRLMTVHSSFYSRERAQFLELLHSLLPDQLSHSFISSTGTESVEAALKFARLQTGKPGVISAKRAYHGRTLGALSTNGTKKYRDPFEPLLSHMAQVAFNDIEAIREAYTDEIGAIILEPIQGEAGVFIPDEGYLADVKAFCEEKGIVLIFDEVQSGFRTGALLASTQFGVVPDIVCLSKALGNGMPVAVTATTADVAESIPKGSHGTTFGSNPLACRAAYLTLSIIQDEDLFARSREVAEYFSEQLRSIELPIIRDVRAAGLFIGVELKKKTGPYVRNLQQDHNILVMTTGTVLRFLPSLTFTKEDADRVIAALKQVLIEA